MANIVLAAVSPFLSLVPPLDEPYRDNTNKTPAVRTLILQIYILSCLPLLASEIGAL
jgi:hypothetical protein